MTQQQPNIDNADDGNMTAVLASWLKSFIRENLDDMLPARVVSYNDQTNRAVIQPLVMIGTTDGGKVSRAGIQNIPVFRFGGGGFFMRYPIKPGDFGWLKSNDRDISLIFQRGGQEDWPNTLRLHNFSDAMFFPDTLRGWAIDGENADAMVIQSLNGAVCIALHDGKLTMKAPEMDVNIPMTRWNGDIVQTGNKTTNGNHAVNGDSDSNGGTMKHNGVNIGSDHDHDGPATAPQGPVSPTGKPRRS